MASQESNNEDTQEAKENASSVGSLLRASRLRIGDDLRFVAETLHIRYIYLEAIEAGHFDELPGTAYAIGFIRSYADYLGLDSEEVVRRYKAESASQSGDTKLVFPVPIPESSIPGGAIVFVGVVVALLAYGGWYVSTAKDGFLAGLVSPVPERLSEQTQTQEPEMQTESIQVETPEQAEVEDTEVEPQGTGEMEEQAASDVASQVVEEVQQTVETVEQAASEIQETAAAESTSSVETVVGQVQEPVQAITEPVQAVAEPVQAVTEPVQADTEPVQAVTEPVQAITEPVQADTEPVQATTELTPSEPVSESTPTELETAEAPEAEPAEQVETETAPSGEGDTEERPAESEVPAAPVETASAPSNVEADPSGRVYGSENEDFRILVKARKNSWIQVRDNNANRLVMTRLLRAGDSYRVPDQSGLVLLTGNAGALEILVDGEAVPDLGKAGTVQRNVTLDPDLLRQGTAAE
jgi:cytoskeleton protein RodZ